MTPRQSLSTSSTAPTDVSRVILIRHGDRFDYANPQWLSSAAQYGSLLSDPPLSALGHKQARETADHLMKKCSNGEITVDKILVSPYLRTIQTAVPTSQAFRLPINIEDGLSEATATPDALPSPAQRFAYFPEIDPSYSPHVTISSSPGHTCQKTKLPCESFPADYIKRLQQFISILEKDYVGQTVVLFSHAATTALVAGMLKCSLRDIKFAPCGIYQLERNGDGDWQLITSGGSNEHVSENSSTTYPWGYRERHFEQVEGMDLDYFVESVEKSNL